MSIKKLTEVGKLRNHLFVSLLISAIPYAIVMIGRDFFPDLIPDRDQLGAYTLLIAFVLFAYRTLRLGNFRKNWIYLLVLTFILVMFLEESEFLSEISFFGRNFYFQYRPPFVMEYLKNHDMLDTRWRSFHNFFYFIFTLWWKDYFDRALILFVLKSNIIAFVLPLSLVALERISSKKKDRAALFVKNFSLSTIVLGGIQLLLLISALVGAKEQFDRSVPIFALLLATIFTVGLIAIGILNFSWARFNRRLLVVFQALREKLNIRLISIALISVILAAVFSFQIAQTHFEIGHTLQESQLWIILGTTLVGLLSLLGLTIIGVDGFFHWDMTEYLKKSKAFFRENPMFIYLVSYSLLLIFAQLFDWKVLSREGQRYIREEVIEFASAVQLIMVGLLIPGGDEAGKNS